MKVIDFHAHIYPENIREKAIRSMEDDYVIKMDCDGSIDTLLLIGKQAGISRFVALGVASAGRHVTSVNDFIIKEAACHEELIGFGTMHPDFAGDMCTELDRIFAAGLKGIKLHPSTQRFKIDDERMSGLYEYLSCRGIPLLTHCGDYRYDYDNPERIAGLLDKFKGLKLIAAHMGGWLLYDRALDALKDKDCYLDCSSAGMYTGGRHLKELIRSYGAERIVFGSDFPVWDPASELEHFFELGLTEHENELILHENACAILENI